MAQRVLSISLGSEIVKVCEVALAGKNKVQVFNAIDLMIPEGFCDDGVILDAQGLANCIMEGLKGEGFTAKRIVFSISSKRIANKEAVIPYCKENRIMDIVRINAAEYFPIANMDDYVLNYSIMEVTNKDNVKNYRLSVIATPKDLVEQYYALAAAMKMSVAFIDYSGNSILQLLKLQTAGDEVSVILQMGAENTVVNVMNGHIMVMQRRVPYGRSVLIDALINSQGVSEDTADVMLMEEDIAELAERYADVAEAVRALFSSINRIVEFYSGRHHEHPIEHIYMIGDAASVNGLVELFNREWDKEVILIDKLHGIDIKNRRNVNDEIAANYLANIGALLVPMKIEVAQEKKQKKAAGMPWWILILSAGVAVAMCAGVLYLHSNAKKENEELQAQIDSFGELENLKDEYTMMQNSYNTIADWYDTTKSPNETVARFVNDLERLQPSAVAVTRFTSRIGEVVIEGTSVGKPPVAQYVIALKSLPYVTDVKTEFINENFEDYNAKDTFKISLNLIYEDPYAEETSEADAVVDQIVEDIIGEPVVVEEVPIVDDSQTVEDNQPEGEVVVDDASNSEGGEA